MRRLGIGMAGAFAMAGFKHPQPVQHLYAPRLGRGQRTVCRCDSWGTGGDAQDQHQGAHGQSPRVVRGGKGAIVVPDGAGRLGAGSGAVWVWCETGTASGKGAWPG